MGRMKDLCLFMKYLKNMGIRNNDFYSDKNNQ